MSEITKVFLDIEAVLKPLEGLDWEAVGKLRAAASSMNRTKILVTDVKGIEIERIIREKL